MASINDEVNDQLLEPVYHENCPGCKVDRQKRIQTGLPIKELVFIWIIVLCVALPISSLFPFLYFMVRDFNIAEKEEDISYYAGFVGSSYMIGRALTSVFWGVVADRYGRKPVILLGTSTVVIFNTLFGFSVNYRMAIITRFLLGFLNGLLGPIKAYASELFPERHQALGLSSISTSWGIGLIFGPALGGFLAQPAEKFPSLVSSDSLFGRTFTSDESSDEDAAFFEKMMFEIAREEEAESSKPIRTRKTIKRERQEAHDRLFNNYFAEGALFEDKFKRRFRMNKRLFLRIVNDLETNYKYFQLRWDARGRMGLSPLQKCVAAIRQLAYGITSDAFDEYLHIGERTARQCLYKFCKYVRAMYHEKYMCRPSWSDVTHLYEFHEAKHGFPGMIGSIDCMHWEWTSCPNAWRGQFHRGDHARPTIMLEAVASQDLWFWHAYFGVAGSNNDLNVLQQSTLLNRQLNGEDPECSFEVNGTEYEHGYYLADGIYPEYSVFVKTLTAPTTEKRRRYANAQEGARKDVERAFACLKKKWKIIENPARSRHKSKISNIIYACMILHNMIREDEGKAICPYEPDHIQPSNEPKPQHIIDDNFLKIHNRDMHHSLRSDLIEHIDRIWEAIPPHEDDSSDEDDESDPENF